jgi:hypothetical protein
VQIVVNCGTRLCNQFLGSGDHFLQSYGAIFTDLAATGSGKLKKSMSTRLSNVKVHPEKKPQSKKKTRRCPIGNQIFYRTPSIFF